MKSFATFLLVLIVFSTMGQQSNNFVLQNFKSNYPISDSFLLDKTTINQTFDGKDLIPKSAMKTSFTSGPRTYTNDVGNQARMLSSDYFTSYMGTSTTKNMEFFNQKAKSTYIFDMNGNLRSSQFSLSFGKKK